MDIVPKSIIIERNKPIMLIGKTSENVMQYKVYWLHAPENGTEWTTVSSDFLIKKLIEIAKDNTYNIVFVGD